jgi:hypothetical protein
MFFSAVFLAAARCLLVTSAARTPGGARRFRSGQKRFPAVRAAKVKRLDASISAQGGRFVHRHSANGIFGHSDEVCSGLKHFERGIARGPRGKDPIGFVYDLPGLEVKL